MKSTGEVMGVGETFAEAFLKSQRAAGVRLPAMGTVFISVKDADKPRAIDLARILADFGFTLVATRGTAAALAAAGVPVTPVNKVHEGRPHIVDMMKNDEIALVVNTVQEKRSAIHDSYQIRREALTDEIPTYTTLAGARAAAMGLAGRRELVPYAIQALHRRLH
jgi:carbamoyl-phosphate synthase large subunit